MKILRKIAPLLLICCITLISCNEKPTTRSQEKYILSQSFVDSINQIHDSILIERIESIKGPTIKYH